MSNRSNLPHDDYLRALGLLTLISDANREVERLERSLANLLGAGEDPYGAFGHVSDTVHSEIYKDPPRVALDDLLRKLGLEVHKTVKTKHWVVLDSNGNPVERTLGYSEKAAIKAAENDLGNGTSSWIELQVEGFSVHEVWLEVNHDPL